MSSENCENCNCETGPQEAQRLTREATTSRSGGPLGPSASSEDNSSPQPGTEDVPNGA